MAIENEKPKKHRFRGKNRKIKFETEIITKDQSEDLAKTAVISKPKITEPLENKVEIPVIETKEVKTKKRKKQIVIQTTNEDDIQNEDDNIEENKTHSSSDISKRKRKKLKHEELTVDKKNKQETAIQDKIHSYLNDWKYNNSNWKFKKLNQVWLVNNLYDTAKIEDDIWDIVIEYFNNSRGKVRQDILAQAVTIIEKNQDDDESNKLKRARDLVQSLQE